MSRSGREPIRKLVYANGAVRWRCVIDAGLDRDGRRRQATKTFDTLKEARVFVASTRVAVNSGTYVDCSRAGTQSDRRRSRATGLP